MKKWIIIILAVLLTVGAGLMVPVLMNANAGSTRRVDLEGGAVETKSPPIATQKNVSDVEKNNDVIETPKEVGNKESPEIVKDTPRPSVPLKTQNRHEENGETTITTPVPSPTPTNNVKSESWVERKIREHRDEISDYDLADFRRIYSKVDIGYIQGLGRDGYDEEETAELKAYLQRTLGGDYDRAKELFFEYSYILEEE